MTDQKSYSLKGQKLVTIQSAAEILQVSPATLRNWDKQKKLPAKRHPKNGYRLYDISDLEHFAQTHHLKRSSANPKIKLIQ